MRVAVAALARKQEELLPGITGPPESVQHETKALEPEASPVTNGVREVIVASEKTEKQELKKKSQDDGKRRQRRTSMKKVKYVQEDDMSEEEEVLLADKKKRAQQLDYQLRAVRW